jgi:5-formyltetrahydrofolate cyclo-ligase
MALAAQSCSRDALAEMSQNIMRRLERHPLFVSARTVLLFHSLPDEPCTHRLIAGAAACKRVLLPVVTGPDTMELREYLGPGSMGTGAFGISEPQGSAFTDYASIDLAVIPGVAFDASGNRLGRGRGYYDRMLPKLASCGVHTIGVAFDFQKVPEVPCLPHDMKVDEVL